MNTLKNRVLFEKGLLPIRAGDLCKILGEDARLENLSPDTMITCFSFIGVYEPLREGFLLLATISTRDSSISKKLAEGGAAVLTNHSIDGVPTIVVENRITAAAKLLTWQYGAIALPSVIVTGSAGKTTTKRMINAVLSSEKAIFSTNENCNILQELCCFLQSVRTQDQVVVWEVCENVKRMPAICSEVLKPDVVVVTNVGDSHLGYIGGREEQNKLFREFTAGMNEDGVVVINADDPRSLEIGFDKALIRVGIQDTAADCVAYNIVNTRTGTEFDLCFRGEEAHVRLSVFGLHNVYDAMMAYVVGVLNHIGKRNILKALKSYRNVGFRQNIVRFGGVTVYMDCYNSSGKAVSFAIPCFCELPGTRGKRVAVLGDVAEIEGYEEDTYREIAKAVDDSTIDVLLTIGRDSSMIHDFVQRDIEQRHFTSKNELNAYLKDLNSRGKNSYLFKASRSERLEESIRAVFPAHYFPMKLVDKFVSKYLWE